MDGNEILLLGLGIQAPWRLVDQHLDVDKQPHELHLTVSSDRGQKYACPVCGAECAAHDFQEKTWRHLNFFQHHCYIHASVPRVRCPEHGVKLVDVPWARKGSAFTLLFEQAALDVVSTWQFEGPGTGNENANNTVDVRFEISGDRDRATRNFLRRYRDRIKESVAENLRGRGIAQDGKGEKISIPARDTSEPTFRHGAGGRVTHVVPGNEEFTRGDRIAKPKGAGSGSGPGQASNEGEGLDEFVFQINQQEFLDALFDDMELPNLTKRQLAGLEEFKRVKGGFASDGAPSNISVVRSMRSATMRRIALGAGKRTELRRLEAELQALADTGENRERRAQLESEIDDLRERLARIPFIDDVDIRYHRHIKEPVPHSKAVMFCLMDVSGSMDQNTKDLAKRFYILLYLFLSRNYDKTEVVFNGDWFRKMTFEDVLRLNSEVTMQQMLQREDFKNRIDQGREVRLHEIQYPIVQGWDSVEVRADGVTQRADTDAGLSDVFLGARYLYRYNNWDFAARADYSFGESDGVLTDEYLQQELDDGCEIIRIGREEGVRATWEELAEPGQTIEDGLNGFIR